MGQNLLLLPERSPDILSFSDGAQSLYGSSSPNSAVFHTLSVKCLHQLTSIQGVSNMLNWCFRKCSFLLYKELRVYTSSICSFRVRLLVLKLGWGELKSIDCIPLLLSLQAWERAYIYCPTKSMTGQYWVIPLGEGVSLIRIVWLKPCGQPYHFRCVQYWLTDCSISLMKYWNISRMMYVILLKWITEQN